MSVQPLITPSPTFGLQLAMYNGSTYDDIGGLYDLTPPNKISDAEQDVTSHDDASQTTPGIRRFVAPGTFTFSEVQGEYYEDTASSRNAGQVALEGAIGATKKFKITFVAATNIAAVFFNAIVREAARLPQPIDGKIARRFILKPTGVPPTS